MENIYTVDKKQFNDIAFVVPNYLFELSKSGYFPGNNDGKFETIGCIFQNNEYVTINDALFNCSERIKISQLTHESIESYKKSGHIVFFVRKKEVWKGEKTIVYSIIDVLAPNLCGAQEEFSFDKTIEETETPDIYFVSFNTRGGRTYGHSSVDSVEFIECAYNSVPLDFFDHYRIIDNTVFISTDSEFDNDGWVCGGNSANTIWVFDKRDGAYEDSDDESTTIKYITRYTKEPATRTCQLCRMYNSTLRSENPFGEEHLIGGIVNLGGKIFDTINVEYLLYDREYFRYDGCYLDEWDNDLFFIGDDGEYETLLKRLPNGRLDIEINEIRSSDDDE